MVRMEYEKHSNSSSRSSKTHTQKINLLFCPEFLPKWLISLQLFIFSPIHHHHYHHQVTIFNPGVLDWTCPYRLKKIKLWLILLILKKKTLKSYLNLNWWWFLILSSTKATNVEKFNWYFGLKGTYVLETMKIQIFRLFRPNRFLFLPITPG